MHSSKTAQKKNQMVKRMKKNNVLLELFIGILLVGIIWQAVCLIFFEKHLYNAVGLWVGVAIATGMAVHMKRSIEDGLDLMGDSGAKHMQKASVTRMALACIAMAVVLYYEWGNPLTLLAGVMTLKLGAYLQPFVHSVLEKVKKGG